MKQVMRSRRGFSLLEMTIAVLMVSLISMAVAMGVNASARVYNRSTTKSECQMLASTLLGSIENELRYARDVDEGSMSFYSDTYGGYVHFNTCTYVELAGVTDPAQIAKKKSQLGKIRIGEHLLIGSGAYGSNTTRPKWAQANISLVGGDFKVVLDIYENLTPAEDLSGHGRPGSTPLWTETVYVTPLNSIS